MTPTQFLEAAARLMEERPEVRPKVVIRGVPHAMKCRQVQWRQTQFRWSGGGESLRPLADIDALAHIVAAWSERVARDGRDLARFLLDMDGDFYAALLEAVKASIES